MSLEEALAENTAALTALATIIRSMGSPFPQPGDAASPLAAGTPTGAPAPRGPGRPKKTDAAPPAAGTTTVPETGDPAGTKYYENVQHKTVFSVKPGEKLDPALGGIEITAADFVAKRAAPAVGPAAAPADPFAMSSGQPAAGADPFAMDATPPAPPKTLQDCVNTLKDIDVKHGRPALTSALAAQGAQNVGGLNTPGRDFNAVYAAFKTLLDQPKAA